MKLDRKTGTKEWRNGYRTSVSIEPMLDTVENLWPLVTDTIWIGKMNKAGQRVKCETPEDIARLKAVLDEQTPAKIRQLYDELADNPNRWKESIASELGLPAEEDNWSTIKG
jgi:hypothetical protein